MTKKKDIYLCASCGGEFAKWHGRCPDCGEWNTIADSPVAPLSSPKAAAGAIALAGVEFNETSRIETGIGEFNLVCGGGIVPGSVVLIGGEPGIGKSTLALQLASYMDTLYVSGEESPFQIRQRADRLGLDIGRIKIMTSTAVEDILLTARRKSRAVSSSIRSRHCIHGRSPG